MVESLRVCVCWRDCIDRVGVEDALKPHSTRWKPLIPLRNTLFYLAK